MRPLFYDALSGDFEPQSDPLHRKHTVGRLAIATFLKGEVIEDYDSSDVDLIGIRYTPSWAPRVKVLIDGLQDGKFFHPVFIDLASRNPRIAVQGFDVGDDSLLGNDGYGLEVGDNPQDVSLLLELGEDLDGAKTYIAERAQVFFDSIHTATATEA